MYLLPSFRLALILVSPLCLAAPATELVVSNLDEPVFMTAPTGEKRYLFILEKKGIIRIFDRQQKKLLEQPFLDLSHKIKVKMNEQGLLGMAFSPRFDSDHRFYLYYTDLKGDTRVSRFTTSPAVPLIALATSEEPLISQKQDFRNHNGGWIGFGPDEMLYIGLGDGGAANDPRNRSQDLSTLLGKLLRIDVNTAKNYAIPEDNPYLSKPDAKKEILSYGLRNPWRCAWHGNDLIIADVGQNKWEEINCVSHQQLFSANFGWPQIEADRRTKKPLPESFDEESAVKPIYQYKHGNAGDEGLSITGGYVYRGSVEELRGHYFFADHVKPHIWSIDLKHEAPFELKHWADDFKTGKKPIARISSFAEDPQGDLYILSLSGTIHKVVAK